MEKEKEEVVNRETIFDEEGHIKEITLGMAEKMLDAALKWADEMTGFPCSVTVVDAAGAVIAVQRGDGAPPGTLDIAIEKAWSAVAMGMPTLMIARMTDPKAAMAVGLGMHGMGLNGRHKGRLCGIHGGSL
jgi:uncharacterized protein GlcG (DUF336 family)